MRVDSDLGGAVRAQCEKGLGNAIGSVANDVFFAGEIAGDAANAESFNARNIGFDGRAAFGRITRQRLRRKGRGIHDGIVEDGRTGVLVDALDMLGGCKAEALIGLGHQVADEDTHTPGVGERGGMPWTRRLVMSEV